jgi:hypothetical protein
MPIRGRLPYTYKGYDGYAPIAAYVGNEGWCLSCELRPGSQHAQKEFGYTLDAPRAATDLGTGVGAPGRRP